MMRDLHEFEDETEIVADLIVVGGGMGGIALAREWMGSGRSVALLEAGGTEFEEETQQLYAGTARMRGPGNPDRAMDAYLTTSRFRYYGGTGNAWNGKCVALDPWDFERRAWVPESGWPISRNHLQPYYDRACDLMGVPRFDGEFSARRIPGRPHFALDGRRQFTSIPRYYTDRRGSAPGGAFDVYRYGLTEDGDVTVYLHANLTEIVLQPGGEHVDHLEIRTLRGGRHRARGQVVVIAAGAIENARLLLASQGVQSRGIGNAHDLVGRFFQGHIHYEMEDAQRGGSGVYLTGKPPVMSLYTDRPSDRVHAVLAATGQAQRTYGISSFSIDFFSRTPPVTAAARGALSVAERLAGGKDGEYDPETHFHVYFQTEQIPNRESRIRLGEDRDALGMRRVHLDWSFSELDFDLIERAIDAFTQELGKAGRGRVQFALERSHYLETVFPVHHHMGSTRMHNDPKHGVVDEQCRVHGVNNLFMVGSSVFPTSGTANPTLTLLALALRLSDHLKSTLGVH